MGDYKFEKCGHLDLDDLSEISSVDLPYTEDYYRKVGPLEGVIIETA